MGYSLYPRNILPGELALYSGMWIEAKDGKVGKLDELVLDKDSGELNHVERWNCTLRQ